MSDKLTTFAKVIPCLLLISYGTGLCTADNKQQHLIIMRKLLFALIGTIFFGISTSAQKKFSVYAIGFYNVEKLVLIQHMMKGKNDHDFTPTGSYQWNEMKYSHKLHNMASVLAEMGTDVLPNVGCAVIGLAEVENDHVMSDLTAQPELAKRGYKYVHIEGPDHRGIDCALIYNPKLFTVRDTKLVPYVYDLPRIVLVRRVASLL